MGIFEPCAHCLPYENTNFGEITRPCIALTPVAVRQCHVPWSCGCLCNFSVLVYASKACQWNFKGLKVILNLLNLNHLFLLVFFRSQVSKWNLLPFLGPPRSSRSSSYLFVFGSSSHRHTHHSDPWILSTRTTQPIRTANCQSLTIQATSAHWYTNNSISPALARQPSEVLCHHYLLNPVPLPRALRCARLPRDQTLYFQPPVLLRRYRVFNQQPILPTPEWSRHRHFSVLNRRLTLEMAPSNANILVCLKIHLQNRLLSKTRKSSGLWQLRIQPLTSPR